MQGKGRLLLVFLFSATLTEATGGISVWAEPVTEDLFQAVAQGKNDLLYCSSTAMLQRHEIVALSLPAFITGVGTAIDADGSIGVSLDRPTHIAIADPRRRGLPRSGGGHGPVRHDSGDPARKTLPVAFMQRYRPQS